jgi:hypothetical protein
MVIAAASFARASHRRRDTTSAPDRRRPPGVEPKQATATPGTVGSVPNGIGAG